MAVSSSKKNPLFYILKTDRQIVVYDSSHKSVQVLIPRVASPDTIAVDSLGQLYVADANANCIDILSAKGELLKTLSVYRPLSLAVLSNGNIVVASPYNGQLLHVYDSSGRLLKAFGALKPFESKSDVQNNFLNRGKVLVDSTDTIHIVYKYAPIPMVQSFSPKGKLLSEFTVRGSAIDVQLEAAQEFLRNRSPEKIGGIGILNSAAIDSDTGHLWMGMNGSSDSGVLYEYKLNGRKLQEYKLLTDAASYPTRVITDISHVVVRTPSVYAFTMHGALRFDLNRTMPDSDDLHAEATCPVAVEFNNCKTPCGTDTPNDDKDCKAELEASVNMSGRRIIDVVCNADSTSCLAQIKLCKESNGVITTHNVQLTCSNNGGGGCIFIDNCAEGIPNYETCTCDPLSPILIDVQGNGFYLTDAAGGVSFDLNADGHAGHIAWTAANSGDAFLVLDRNGNGAIDDGTELYGNLTPQSPSSTPNGFTALAEYDKPQNGGNSDGQIDARDAIFASLQLWQDTNHNGISELGELHTLPALGVYAISLDYRESRRIDRYGNQFKYRAKVYDAHGTHVGHWAWDVFFVSR